MPCVSIKGGKKRENKRLLQRHYSSRGKAKKRRKLDNVKASSECIRTTNASHYILEGNNFARQQIRRGGRKAHTRWWKTFLLIFFSVTIGHWLFLSLHKLQVWPNYASHALVMSAGCLGRLRVRKRRQEENSSIQMVANNKWKRAKHNFQEVFLHFFFFSFLHSVSTLFEYFHGRHKSH